jgi:hypothetical protein
VVTFISAVACAEPGCMEGIQTPAGDSFSYSATRAKARAAGWFVGVFVDFCPQHTPKEAK